MGKEIIIYIYRDKGMGDRLKIGQTKRTVERRFKEQTGTSQSDEKGHFELLLAKSFQREDGSYLTDYDIHKRLEAKGFIRPKGAGRDWRICSLEDVLGVIHALQYNNPKLENRTLDFELRPEQRAAIKQTMDYFQNYCENNIEDKVPKFLWNAKMRFGKCFTTYHLAKKMNWSKLLVLTYKPVVSDSWRKDLEDHIDFYDWVFTTSKDSFVSNLENGLKSVVFFSFQDLLGSGKRKLKAKHEWILNETWDCLVIDEYHFGARGNLARDLYETDFNDKTLGESAEHITRKLIKKHLLCLSGTPFKSIESGEFNDVQIFNWSYLDEQFAKENWDKKNGQNPYIDLPRLNFYLYAVPDWVVNMAKETSNTSFDLNYFFSADLDDSNEYVFNHKRGVERFLNILNSGQIQKNNEIRSEAMTHCYNANYDQDFRLSDLKPNHMVWFFSNVSSCCAMKNLLKECQYNFFSDFKIILAAGSSCGSGKKALEYLNKEMANHSKTITLTCGKLMTGVTVPDWDTILLFTNLKAPETYFQSIFRVQSPFSETFKGKENCYVVDFNPNRALLHLAYNFVLNPQDNKSSDIISNTDFTKFMPILMFEGFKSELIDLNALQNFFYSSNTDENLISGWKNSSLLNTGYLSSVQEKDILMKTIGNLPGFNSKPLSKGKNVSNTPGIDEGGRKSKGEREKENSPVFLKEKDIIDKLKFLISRLYLFFYLYNEYIDRSDNVSFGLKELLQIERDEEFAAELFKQITTLSIEEFKELLKYNLINRSQLEGCIQRINYKIESNSRNRDNLFIKK